MAIKTNMSILDVFGEKNNSMWLINYTKDKTEEIKTIPESIHHIQILDRSDSMYYNIGKLIDDCKKTIEQMSDNDYYTVIWFSSAGEYRTILKGIKNDKENRESSFRLLDSIKSTIGLTCFSESIEETEKIIDELTALCSNFSVTLFTDGEAVTPWEKEEEYNRVNIILDRIKDKIISFNTIGYGNYCNEKILNHWANKSEFGEFIHSSKIDEYHEIFEENTERIKNLEKDSLELSFPGKIIYYFTGNSVSRYIDSISLKHIDKKKNQFLIISRDPENINGTINGKEIILDSNKTKSIPKAWIPSLLYKIALAEFNNGDRYNTVKILGCDLKDKNLVDKQISSFTPDEISKFKKCLKNAAFRNIGRNINTAPDNYIPSENAPCLIDLLTILTQSKDNLYVIPSDYKRIGRKTNDEFNMFKKSNIKNTVPIENITFNEKKLNISIGFEIPGIVEINPKQASKVGLDSKVPCKIFRNHTIVKDGYLNMETITVEVNERTRDEISANFANAITSITTNDKLSTMIIKLSEIPIINASYGNTTIEELFKLICTENKLKAYVKLAKEYNKNNKTLEAKKYTDEQCLLLEEYGIKNGIYNGIKTNIPKVEDSDYYMGRVFELSLKGFSKLSPIKMNEDNIPTIEKPANGDAYLLEAIKDYNICKSEKEYIAYKTLLSEIKAKIAGIRIAKILCGKWFEFNKLNDTKKDEVKTYIGMDNILNKELTLNIKTTYEKCYF